MLGFDTGPKLLVRLIAPLIGLVLGPLPIAALAWLGLRSVRRDPTLRGGGRAVFALVVAFVLTLPCLAGLAGAVLRR
jgi:hypothetical protein